MPQSKPNVEQQTPSHLTLVETYLRLQFGGVSAIVFLDPLGDGSRVELIAKATGVPSSELSVSFISADVYILPSEDLTLRQFDEDEYGYVVAWDGSSIVSENT
jgi:hypothetical protein